MSTTKRILATIALLIVVLASNAHAQWGYPDPMMGMDALMQQHQQWNAQLNGYDRQMDAYVQQQMQQAQLQADAAYARVQRFFIDYYRQHTGDHVTPDAQAMALGDRLYCQHHPAECRQSATDADSWMQLGQRLHDQRMNDIAAAGRTALDIGRTNDAILDAGHAGFQERQQLQDQGRANHLQGAIHGEGTFVNPHTGAGFSLPLQPDPSMSYRTPDGYPLHFDAGTGTWYQGDGFGTWFPLQANR